MNTKEKIMRIACRNFALNGYEKTTIRGISCDAKVNIAAVNYHYHNKETLYKEVFNYIMKKDRIHIINLDNSQKISSRLNDWREGLTKWLEEILLDISSKEPFHQYKTMIISRELMNPSPVFKDIFKTHLKPVLDNLIFQIKKNFPKNLKKDELYIEIFSVISEAVFYMNARALIRACFPKSDFTSKNIKNIVKHTVLKIFYG
ncbi:MAG TPA: TetR/AcrR family transcriptional regulator [Victivallales bacterium]|mgnify:FL=1|nr:TetR/AcrR family transcriptional regulator [Victivallales bacterium]